MHLLFRMGKEDGRRNREMGKMNLWKPFFSFTYFIFGVFFFVLIIYPLLPPLRCCCYVCMYVSISTTMCSIRFFLIFTVIDILNSSSPSWLSKFFFI